MSYPSEEIQDWYDDMNVGMGDYGDPYIEWNEANEYTNEQPENEE